MEVTQRKSKEVTSDFDKAKQLSNNDNDEGRVYCANCVYCVLLRTSTGDEQYVLRVKCIAKKWKKKLGEEKIYKFFTVARRTVEECDIYEPMGELKSYLKDLRKSLPIKDEVYSLR